jgi:hypothetical protein
MEVNMKKIKYFGLLLLLTLNISSSAQTSGKVFWRGMVDAKVHLLIQDSSLSVLTMEGSTQPEGVSSFTSALPRQNVTVGVIKTKGRGTAAVVQQPSRENDFTAIVEIIDSKGGAKEYQLEIFWK